MNRNQKPMKNEPKPVDRYRHELDPNMQWLKRSDRPYDKKEFYIEKVSLLVNWFKFSKNIYDKEYFEYSVQFFKSQRIINRKTGQSRIKESEVPIPERNALFWEHMRSERKRLEADNISFNIENYVFDGKDTVYSVDFHPNTIDCRMSDPKNRDIEYKMKMDFRNRFRLNFSRENPLKDEEADRSYKFLKNVMTQKVNYSPDVTEKVQIEFTKNFVYHSNSILRVPESFHDPDRFNYSLEVAPKIQAWMGQYIAVKELESEEPALNFGMTFKLFVNAPKMSLLDYLLLVVDPETVDDEHRNERKREIKRGLTIGKGSYQKLNQYLANLKLKSSEVWDDRKNIMTERHMNFVEISDQTSETQSILVPLGPGRDAPKRHVPLFQIYRENNKHIEFPTLPLVKVKGGSKTYSVPMECLEIHEKMQAYKGRIDFVMQEKFIKAATQKPHKYKEETIKMLIDMDYSSKESNFVENFGLNTEIKMIALKGKLLKEPRLVNGENKEINMTPVIRGFKEKRLNIVPVKELCCAIFVIRNEDQIPCVKTDEVVSFYEKLIDACIERGIRIGEHAARRERSILYEGGQFAFYDDVPLYNGAGCFQAVANDAKAKFDRLPDKDKKILLFVVISDGVQYTYPFIKQYCDVTLGIASQHVRSKTVRHVTKNMCWNLALKINAKLGGVNQELEYSENAEMTPEEKEKRKAMPLIMYVGIDVTHPTANSGIDFSIASIVASMNPGGTVYANKIVIQNEVRPDERPVAHGRERTDILEGKFVHLLKLFTEKNNNRVPDHIVVYRDGVSDSEMLRVSHDELKSLKNEVKRFREERGETDIVPTFTFIVVQKRHRTRLFRKIEKTRPKDEKEAERWDNDMKESDKTGIVNPSSGTTVDTVIVSKYKFDFYLASHHGVLGTTRPGHYIVMHDEMKMTQGQAHKMTYELAFLSARCRKPISLPAPVHYAHLSCEKAKELYKSFKRHQSEELPWNARRQDIEKYLETNINYPGMSFA